MNTATVDRLGRGRATVEDLGAGVRIVIPARRHLFVITFLFVWLAIWIIAGSASLVGGAGEVAGGLAILAIGVGYGGGVLAWMLFGREVVEAERGRLLLARGVGPIQRRREFHAASVEDLCALDDSMPWWFGFDLFGMRGGSIAFDYGARTYKFGGGVDRAEAKQIVGRLQEALR